MFNKIYVAIKNFIKDNYKFFIFLTFLIFIFYYEFPYIIYKTGGTIDLSDRVVIANKNETNGKLSMSYVTAVKGTIPFMALSYIMNDWDMYPMSEITDEDNDYDDVLEIGKEYLNEGINNAIIAAFNETEYGIKINKIHNKVVYITKEAKTDLEIDDEIISVNNEEVNSLEELRNLVNTYNEGDILEIKVLKDKKEYLKNATVYLASDNTLKIGISLKTTYDYETKIPVTVNMKDNESGSSGGLMMSLAIYNALTEYDITNGKNIVGTGAIESDGKVTEISGVKYKVLAAEKEGADIFFCPKENYKEAKKIKDKRKLKLKVVGVSTLKEAIDYLNNN